MTITWSRSNRLSRMTTATVSITAVIGMSLMSYYSKSAEGNHHPNKGHKYKFFGHSGSHKIIDHYSIPYITFLSISL